MSAATVPVDLSHYNVYTMKKIVSKFVCLLILFQAMSFGFSEKTNGNTKLSVWSFTDDIKDFLDAEGYGYKSTHPDKEVEYTYIPTDQFSSKLDPAIVSGRGAPDVFALEDAFIRKYVECGLLLPLDDLYEEVKDRKGCP